MRRLYSSFAHGAPGAGLLLIRLAVGAVLVLDAVAAFRPGGPGAVTAIGIVSLAAGVLVLIGLTTRVAGVVAATVALWQAFSGPSEPGLHLLASLLGVALALLGPGGWSVDARLFGWKRIEIRNVDPSGHAGDDDAGDSTPA